MLKTFFALLSAAVLTFGSFVTPAVAQSEETSGRASIYEFLNIPANPRAAAMGNAFVAMKNDQNTIFSNPAALATIEADSLGRSVRISAGFLKHIKDINEGYISWGSPSGSLLGVEGGVAAAVQYIDYGTFDGRDINGAATGEFGAQEMALTLAYAGHFRGVNFGIGAKLISSNLVSGSSVQDYSSFGGALDAGLFYEYEPLLMTFGVSALNIGTQFSTYAGIDEPLPFNLQLGISKKLERLPLTLHLAFRRLSRDREGRNILYAFHDFALGGEFILGKVVRLRFGYENQKRRDLNVPKGNGLAGFSLGTGIYVKQYQFDLSYNHQGHAFVPLVRFGGSVAW
ncbi:MAG TPA: PorV/PorQ family protein [Candidatus Kapabacteria bacterium]|nr:PorV/PorQ family protein [Candidatus Kapabacteria bacterium]